MDIKTDTPLVKKAREGVMEFLLVRGLHMSALNLRFECLKLLLRDCYLMSFNSQRHNVHESTVHADQPSSRLPHL